MEKRKERETGSEGEGMNILAGSKKAAIFELHGSYFSMDDEGNWCESECIKYMNTSPYFFIPIHSLYLEDSMPMKDEASFPTALMPNDRPLYSYCLGYHDRTSVCTQLILS